MRSPHFLLTVYIYIVITVVGETIAHHRFPVQIFSDAVFALQNFKDGNITKKEYREYLDVRKTMLAGLPLPHVAVYLDVSPTECYDRIHNMRQRACESSRPRLMRIAPHQ